MIDVLSVAATEVTALIIDWDGTARRASSAAPRRAGARRSASSITPRSSAAIVTTPGHLTRLDRAMQYLATSMPRWHTVLLIFLSLASGNRSFPASRAWEIFAMDHDAGDVADAAAFTASRARRKKSPTAQASWPAQPNSLIAAEIAPIKGILILMMQTLGITTVSASVLRQLPPGK